MSNKQMCNAIIKAERNLEKILNTYGSVEKYEELQGMSLSDLSKLNSMVVNMIKIKRGNINKDLKHDLKIGDLIEINDYKFKGDIFEVLKLNPKKVKCKRENGEIWNIPYSYVVLK